MSAAKTRCGEIDFVKAVMIALVILSHLSLFTDVNPIVKTFVINTFAMPAFLLMSGYFCNSAKPARLYFKHSFWLLVPYLLLNGSYILACSCLPIREHIEHLTWQTFAFHLLVRPLGPYWYLQTLILCQILGFVVMRLNLGRSFAGNIILLALAVYAFKDIMVFFKAMYFVAGFAMARLGVAFLAFFRASWWSLVPLVLLVSDPQNLDQSTLPGVVITYLVISLCLAAYPCLTASSRRLSLFVGRNTLTIYLFSPIFTLASKVFSPLFAWDGTRICYAIVAVAFVIAGSLALTWLIDKVGISRFMFGRRNALQ